MLYLGCGAVDVGCRGGARPSGVTVMPPDHARAGTGRMTPATECGGARAHTHAPESQLGATSDARAESPMSDAWVADLRMSAADRERPVMTRS
jgi:hypothetical protein